MQGDWDGLAGEWINLNYEAGPCRYRRILIEIPDRGTCDLIGLFFLLRSG